MPRTVERRQIPRVDDVFNEENERKRWAALYFPYFIQAYKQGIGQISLNEQDLFTKFVLEALRKKSFEHASLAVGTTKDFLQSEFSASFQAGESIAELAKRVDNLFGEKMKYRSKLIARTELTPVINDGALQTLIFEGFTQKEWRTVIDGRERPAHAAAHGQVVDIRSPFTVGGELAQVPGADSLSMGQKAQCRCTITGAGFPEERKLRLDTRFIRVHGALERSFMVQLRRAFLQQRNRVLANLPT